MLMINPGAANSQAAEMPELSQKPVKVIGVTGGKGGIGKTNVSINLATALAEQGKEVLLLDADLGLANIDVALGLHPNVNLSHVMSGEAELKDVMVDGPHGMKIIPASSGVSSMVEMSSTQHAAIINSFSSINDSFDVLIVDTAAGISGTVVSFLRAVQDIIVVVCNEPTSIADAYALIKVLYREQGLKEFKVLVNMTDSNEEARKLFAKLHDVTQQFLDITLQYLGAVPFDEQLRKAIKRQKAVVDLYPRSKSAFAYRNIATSVNKWPTPRDASGRIEFFVERLL